ncbi:MAG TPA: sensor domain-containing diguanylate cyclase [Pyrinomonadaceae bacterium]|jgi:diguanylate cyclase (GGDEF)-like protein
MSKHVVLMADTHGAPAPSLTAALREAGLEVSLAAEHPGDAAIASSNGNGASPLAVLYEIAGQASTMELYAVVERASLRWPDAPLVACRHYGNGQGGPAAGRHSIDDGALKRLGFKTVAASPAQLPALLRELEERGRTGELSLPKEAGSLGGSGSLLLPRGLRPAALSAAFELVASLHFASDQKSAAQTALDGLSPLIRAERWTIYLTSEEAGTDAAKLEPLAARGLTESHRELPETDWRRALMGDVLILSGAESQAARESIRSGEIIRRREKQQRILAVPLLSGERVLGVLEAVREGEGARLFSRADASLLGALALPIASALSNSVRIAEAERLSLTDDLTKLHNARFLRQFLLSEIKRARRYGSTVAAFFLDLDDFKGINDGHGHLVGSHVLMEMAAVILSSVRDTDIVARYGGDEFVIILPESGLEQVLLVAERVRERIARHQFHGGRGLSLRLTASFGVAAFPQHAQSPQQLIACADRAMYEAKAANKNCIRLAPEPLPPTF